MSSSHDADSSFFTKGSSSQLSHATETTALLGSKLPSISIDADVERDSAASSALLDDPYGLRDGYKKDLAAIRKRSGKKVETFYRKQNQLITSLLKPMAQHTQEAKEREESARLPVKIAVYSSLVANILLCLMQIYAAIASRSLSLIATGIDSVFDVGSNGLLFWLHHKSAQLDVNKWPVGGARLETIGNIIYGFLMGSVNLVVIVESAQTLLEGGQGLKGFHVPAIVAVGVALGVKFMLFLYCFALRNKSGQVRVLWEDHRNDLFINGFGILMFAGGSKLRWYLDPAGAIIVALGVVLLWSQTVYEEFELLAGKSAPDEFLQLIIYKAATFSDDIQGIDTVRAYHSGPDFFVEVDVVMSAGTPLWKAHDVSELLQQKIEVLPNVERAFVHVDYETSHPPEHRKLV